jgi:FkbH-like protein
MAAPVQAAPDTTPSTRLDPIPVVVAASFTAGPLGDVLDFWSAELGVRFDVTFAPDGQVFQQLLDPAAALARNTNGFNVVLVRPADLGDGAADAAADLAAAIHAAADRSPAPLLVAACPPVPAGFTLAVDRPNVVTVTTDAYPVTDVADAYAERVGGIPFTPTFFAALGTALVRAAHARLTPRPKALVVDCDHTLWDGVVGEDGPAGVSIGPDRQELHRFLADQHDTGRLICLCSKNSEADVAAVFESRSEMGLRTGQLAATRVNWRPKSANLRELADELGVGLDSVVFLDDSPIECAEVRAGCPEALTLQVPREPAHALAFLRHCWPLDTGPVTDEDRHRTERHHQEKQRRQLRSASMSLADFLSRLDVRVRVEPARLEQHARIAQLTQRTNQFNLTGRRYTAADLPHLGLSCLTVDVTDRFGAYGLVGAVLYEVAGDALRVDSFLLSCRVLGRGVEHRMLAHLGALALDLGADRVILPFVPNTRNQPARDFLDQVASTVDGGYELTASAAAAVCHRPDATAPPPVPVAARSGEPPMDWRLVERIATVLADPAAIERAVAARFAPAPCAVTADPLEAHVVRLWTELLGVAPASAHDNFFALGGQSLQLVQFMARVRQAYGVELPVDLLFTPAFTVAEAARTIRERQLDAAGPAALDDALAALDRLSDEEIEALLAAGDD